MTTINTIDDLLRLLDENEQFRDAVRYRILTEDLVKLPQEFREFREEAEKRFDSLEKDVGNLQTGMGNLTTKVDGLQTDMVNLTTKVDGLTTRVDGLETKVDGLTTKVDGLDTKVDGLATTVDKLRGDGLEAKLTGLIPPLLSREFDVRRVYSMWASRTLAANERRDEFEKTLEVASDSGRITDDEETRLQVTDLIVRSQRKSDRSTLWFAVEASGVISDEDVTRVRRSANALNRIYDQDVIPLVYGYEISDENRALASENDVRVYLNPDRR